jgi:hypothetical protein
MFDLDNSFQLVIELILLFILLLFLIALYLYPRFATFVARLMKPLAPGR